MTLDQVLPEDVDQARLIGRVWDIETGGPRVVAIRDGSVFDLTTIAATVSELLESPTVVSDVDDATTTPRWHLADLIDASLARDPSRARLLAPVDLQVSRRAASRSSRA